MRHHRGMYNQGHPQVVTRHHLKLGEGHILGHHPHSHLHGEVDWNEMKGEV